MERPIFEILVEISKEDFVDYGDHSGESNRDQRIREEEKYEKLNYLLTQGLISKTNDIYMITEYGYIVAQHESWSHYLSSQKEFINKKQLKEKLDLKISEFQVRTKLLPYYISALSIIISIIALVNPFESKKENNVPQKSKLIIKENKPNVLPKTKTIITSEPIDSSKIKTSANTR